jgi:hypothetical protein
MLSTKSMIKKRRGSSVILCLLAGAMLFSGRAARAQSSPYSPWNYGPSTSPNFFPIGVWLQSPGNAQEFENIGVNMFVGFFGDLDAASMTTFASLKMPVVPTQNSVGLTSPQRSSIWGWEQIDEPDNAQPNSSGGYGPCITPSALVASYNTIKSASAASPVFLNFGQGASVTSYIGRGSCTGDTTYYSQAIAAGDIISFDVYPVANYNGQLELVANGVDNLKTWAAQCNCGTKPVWNFIETTPFAGGATPTPAQIQSEVWMSLIHGSQGIMYFVHVISPTFREDGIFNYPASVQAVTSIDAQIASLAPVLNSATVTNDIQVASSASGVPLDMMEKNYGGSKYVFAVARANSSTLGTFTVPGNPTGTITVLGESRQIAMTRGQFTDSFTGYGVHLYQFTAGTSSAPAPPTNLKAIAQ